MNPAFLASSALVCSPEDIRLGRLILAAYDQGFGHSPLEIGPQLDLLGFDRVDVIFSHDNIEPEAVYGFIAKDRQSGDLHEVWRGTQDQFEWIGDAEFWPVPAAWAGRGAKIEHGFSCCIDNVRLGSGRPIASLPIIGVEGHSKGASIAEGRAARAGAAYAGLWACPRLGNDPFRDFLLARVKRVFRPYNKGDDVPDVPLDLEPIFEYVHPPGFEIDSGKTVIDSLGARHNLATYLHALDQSVPLNVQYASPA